MELKKFFAALVSADSAASSKRVISLVATVFLMAASVANFAFKVQIQVEIIYALVTCIIGSNALTLFQKTNT